MSQAINQSINQSITNMSLFIPHVFSNISAERITAAFQDNDIGQVSHIDLVSKMDKNGQIYNSAYVHFAFWYQNSTAVNFQERVINPNQQAKLVYDDPWFWIVLKNSTEKHESGARKTRLDLSDSTPAPTNAPTAPTMATIIKKQELQRTNTNAIGKKLMDKLKSPSNMTSSTNALGKKLMDKLKSPVLAAPTPITNLVSDDYVQHLEAMNNQLRDESNQDECFAYQQSETIARLQGQVNILMEQLNFSQYMICMMQGPAQEQEQFQEEQQQQEQSQDL
jgi:hypothetical protein